MIFIIFRFIYFFNNAFVFLELNIQNQTEKSTRDLLSEVSITLEATENQLSAVK